jgi:hypothetical protein
MLVRELNPDFGYEKMHYNGALNGVPHRGRFCVSLLTNGSKARRCGANLALMGVIMSHA